MRTFIHLDHVLTRQFSIWLLNFITFLQEYLCVSFTVFRKWKSKIREVRRLTLCQACDWVASHWIQCHQEAGCTAPCHDANSPGQHRTEDCCWMSTVSPNADQPVLSCIIKSNSKRWLTKRDQQESLANAKVNVRQHYASLSCLGDEDSENIASERYENRHLRRPLSCLTPHISWTPANICITLTTHTTVLRLSGICPGKPGWAGTRRNIHPLLSS